MKTIVSPSLLAADFADLKGDINMINRSEADWLHLDIDKTSLENQAFEAYQAFRANPKGELGILRPMFEWLNFEHVITEV